jgi:hypothetical protein
MADPAANDWCNLSWTQWQPLEADFVRGFAPFSSGIYRIRQVGLAKRLTYIGQTGRTLRERLRGWRMGLMRRNVHLTIPTQLRRISGCWSGGTKRNWSSHAPR